MKVFVYVWLKKKKTQTGEPPPVNARNPNEQKMCEKSHCGKSFLCIFTLLRGDEQHKRRMEMRMKRVRHERRILLGFVKRGRRQRLLLLFYFFLPVLFSSFLDPAKSFLAPFAVVFLHSCSRLSPLIMFLSSCSGCDHKPIKPLRDLSLLRTHTHRDMHFCRYSHQAVFA